MKKIISSLFIFFYIFIPSFLYSQGIVLEKVIIDTQNSDLILDISLNFLSPKKLVNFFTKEGIELVFKADIKLEQDRALMWDKTLFKKSLKYNLSFNPIKNQFKLLSPDGKTFFENSFEDILSKLKNIRINIPLWQKEEKNKKHNLIIEFRLKRKVPYWIEKTLFFWKFDITPKVIYNIRF